MKKICHVSSAHPRYDTRILYRECRSLSERYDVVFIVNDNLQEEAVDKVQIKSTGEKLSSRLQRMTKGVSKIYQLALEQDADLYHLHDPELLRIALKLKKKGKKVIFDSHENYFEQIKIKPYLPKVIADVIAIIYYLYETYVCRRIDGVIMPATCNGKNTFQNRCRKFTLVDNLPRLDEIPNIKRKAYQDRKGICYSGTLAESRGITQITNATKEIAREEELILAGRFYPEKYQNEICNKHNKHVKYLGFISREKIYELYNQCAVGLAVLMDVGQYSQGDNLPTKVYEYMAMELPVVLSDFPHYKKMVNIYKFGLTVNPDDVQDITEKIEYLLENKDIAEKMGKRGRKAFLEIFNWSVAEKNLLEIYEKVLKA